MQRQLDLLTSRFFLLVNLGFLFGLAQCSSQPSDLSPHRIPNNNPRHFIFFVHGIAGDATSAASYPQALEKRLELEDPSFDVVTFIPTYGTSSNTMTLKEASMTIADQIHSFLKSQNNLQGQDKITFVSHSQGGIVSLFWIYASMENEAGFSREEASRVKNMITLGTPYWGSVIANITKYIKSAPIKKIQDTLEPWGLTQLSQMSQLSDSSYMARDKLLSHTDTTSFEIKNNIRFLSVAGAALGYSHLAAVGIGKSFFESDLFVSVPNARFGFLYGDKKLSELKKIGYVKVDRVTLGDFFVTDGTHNGDGTALKYDGLEFNLPNTDWILKIPKIDSILPGIGAVSAECAMDLNCAHPTLNVVKDFILKKELPDNSEMLSKLTGFVVMLNFKSQQSFNLNDFDIKYSTPYPEESKNTVVNSFLKPEIGAKGSSLGSKGTDKMARFWVTGYNLDTFMNGRLTSDGNPYGSRLIQVIWKYKNKIQAPLTIRVSSTHVTFVDIDLDN